MPVFALRSKPRFPGIVHVVHTMSGIGEPVRSATPKESRKIMGEIPDHGVLCPNCGHYYNPFTGHSCPNFTEIELARLQLEKWLGPNYVVIHEGDYAQLPS